MRCATRILLFALSVAPAAFAQAGCALSAPSPSRAFNSSGASRTSLIPRASALDLGTVRWQSPEVLCRFSTAAFQSFRTKIRVEPLIASGYAGQAVCQNACTDQLFNAYGTTLPLNKWVDFCSFTEIPGTSYSCSDLLSSADYQACLTQFCPFLAPELNVNNNPQCGVCLADEMPGEGIKQRVLRCTYLYNPDDASLCGAASASWWFWFVTSF